MTINEVPQTKSVEDWEVVYEIGAGGRLLRPIHTCERIYSEEEIHQQMCASLKRENDFYAARMDR